MNIRRSYIFAAALAIVLVPLVASCSGRTVVIPRGKMAEIYAEMFLLDQRLERQGGLGKLPDTTIVYEGIFEKYGYTWKDYLASREKYMHDPERYSRILKKSISIIEKQKRALEERKRLEDGLLDERMRLKLYHPNRIYLLDSISRDSLGRLDSGFFAFDFDFQKGLDTAYRGPRIILAADSLLFVKDTLTASGDSIKTMPHTLRKFQGKLELKKTCSDSQK